MAAQTQDLLNGFQNSGRKLMDWLEDTVFEIKQITLVSIIIVKVPSLL